MLAASTCSDTRNPSIAGASWAAVMPVHRNRGDEGRCRCRVWLSAERVSLREDVLQDKGARALEIPGGGEEHERLCTRKLTQAVDRRLLRIARELLSVAT